MPEIEIRPTTRNDLPVLRSIQPGYHTTRVWQLDRQAQDEGMGGAFREVRLPREAWVDYPRLPELIFAVFDDKQDLYLTALLDGMPVGYLHLSELVALDTAWVKDWVVREDLRRRGIGAALLLSGQEWSAEAGFRRMVVEMQSKNAPAIQLVRKLGFEFSGFNDAFYPNQDIALFFSRGLR